MFCSNVNFVVAPNKKRETVITYMTNLYKVCYSLYFREVLDLAFFINKSV